MLNRLFCFYYIGLTLQSVRDIDQGISRFNLKAQKPPHKPDSNGKPASRFFIGRGLALDSRNKL